MESVKKVLKEDDDLENISDEELIDEVTVSVDLLLETMADNGKDRANILLSFYEDMKWMLPLCQERGISIIEIAQKEEKRLLEYYKKALGRGMWLIQNKVPGIF